MTKVVSENTLPHHATRCSLGYTFASFFGSPAAGLLAAFMTWQSVFAVSSGALVIMSLCVFLFFSLYERQGIVKYGQYKTEKKGVGNVKVLFKHEIVKYSLISILTFVWFGDVKPQFFCRPPLHVFKVLPEFFRAETRRTAGDLQPSTFR